MKDIKKTLKNKLEKLKDGEIDKVYKKLNTVMSNLKISKGRKITILLSEITENKDDMAGIQVGDLENAIKIVIKERKNK